MGGPPKSGVKKGPATEAQISVRTPTGWYKCGCSLRTLTICERFATAEGFDNISQLVRDRLGNDAAYRRRVAKYDKKSISQLIDEQVIKPALEWDVERKRRR